MSLLLGISPSSHESSAALFKNGELIAAIAEERLTRVKCEGGFPQRSIDWVLRQAGAVRGDVDQIALNYGFMPEQYFRGVTPARDFERRISRVKRRLLGKPPKGPLWVNDLLKQAVRRRKAFGPLFKADAFLAGEGFSPSAGVRFYDHHESHAVCAAYYSGQRRCAVLTMDGVGDLDVHLTTSQFRDGNLRRLTACATRGASLGNFYMFITELLGFRRLRHEGKVLGLAAFERPPADLVEGFLRAVRLQPGDEALTSDFVGLPDAERARYAFLKQLVAGRSREQVASAAQHVTEELGVRLARSLAARTGERALAVNGGVFANVKLNQRLAALPEFDSLFVFPAMSDTGNSVGACLLALAEADGAFLSRGTPLHDVYWGPGFDDGGVEAELHRAGLRFERIGSAAAVERAAQAIHAGRVVGWFQGRMEFGPRALGNRSIVAAATDASINRTLNQRLERTEFMPFAPSVLAERAAELFAGVGKCAHTARFMTITCDVQPDWRDVIPAAVHVDGTARPQLVSKESNPLYHSLISRYAELSGIPAVLNTSFNVHEEPIVCMPGEAVRALHEGRIDDLCIGDCWIGRPEAGEVRTGMGRPETGEAQIAGGGPVTAAAPPVL